MGRGGVGKDALYWSRMLTCKKFRKALGKRATISPPAGARVEHVKKGREGRRAIRPSSKPGQKGNQEEKKKRA